MKLKKQYEGQSILCKSIGKLIKIEDKNKMILHRNDHHHLFQGSADLKPIEKAPESTSDDEPVNVALKLSELSREALNDFKGMKVSEVRAIMDELDIEYPEKATKKELIEIVKNLD